VGNDCSFSYQLSLEELQEINIASSYYSWSYRQSIYQLVSLKPIYTSFGASTSRSRDVLWLFVAEGLKVSRLTVHVYYTQFRFSIRLNVLASLADQQFPNEGALTLKFLATKIFDYICSFVHLYIDYVLCTYDDINLRVDEKVAE